MFKFDYFVQFISMTWFWHKEIRTCSHVCQGPVSGEIVSGVVCVWHVPSGDLVWGTRPWTWTRINVGPMLQVKSVSLREVRSWCVGSGMSWCPTSHQCDTHLEVETCCFHWHKHGIKDWYFLQWDFYNIEHLMGLRTPVALAWKQLWWKNLLSANNQI